MPGNPLVKSMNLNTISRSSKTKTNLLELSGRQTIMTYIFHIRKKNDFEEEKTTNLQYY